VISGEKKITTAEKNAPTLLDLSEVEAHPEIVIGQVHPTVPRVSCEDCP
jgi:hypothetical protein